MGKLPLATRKAQLQLLGDACSSGARACILSRPSGGQLNFAGTRLAALEADSVLVLAPRTGPFRNAAHGAPVQVVFKHRSERYSFAAQLRGVVEPAPGALEHTPLLRLSLPAAVQTRQPRREGRISLGDCSPVRARLTSARDQRFSFELRLTDVSSGGFAGQVDRAIAARLDDHPVFWATFTLPGDGAPYEFVVRPCHRELGPSGTRINVGWIFCGHDEPGAHRWNVDRLRRFVARRQNPSATRSNQSPQPEVNRVSRH
jgi:hypothetical protein